jgi:hypothetical protein
VIERRLSDLMLTYFSIDGEELPAQGEKNFQAELLPLIGVWSFGDWVLLLRHLVFYFEDRRALVWDPVAQRQILRFLFLPVETAKRWTEDERIILELDSRMRNLSAALYREEEALADSELTTDSAMDLRQELQTLEELQERDRQTLEALEGNVVDLAAYRDKARLRFLKAEQEHEGEYRELERAKLIAIGARFPSTSETARYILAQLFTEHTCLVCNHLVPEAAAEYAARIEHITCVICGTDLIDSTNVVTSAEFADRRRKSARSSLQSAEVNLSEAQRALSEAEDSFNSNLAELQDVTSRCSDRSRRIDFLVRQLPADEASVHQQRTELAAMRSRVEQMRRELGEKRQAFAKFVTKVSRQLVEKSVEIRSAFNAYARGFLLESCELVWSPHKGKLGQTGDLIDFPGFELEMTGTNFPTAVRRSGPEQVSESQREFIDLAFRMALIAVAGNRSRGTLILDAPESSLDAVFADRAAVVLSRFAKRSAGNRLIIASNPVANVRHLPSPLNHLLAVGLSRHAPHLPHPRLAALLTPQQASATASTSRHAPRSATPRIARARSPISSPASPPSPSPASPPPSSPPRSVTRPAPSTPANPRSAPA